MKEMKENGGANNRPLQIKVSFLQEARQKENCFFCPVRTFTSSPSNGIQYERELRDKSKTLAKGQSYSILSKNVSIIIGIRTPSFQVISAIFVQ